MVQDPAMRSRCSERPLQDELDIRRRAQRPKVDNQAGRTAALTATVEALKISREASEMAGGAGGI
jgi:hypothetical protein